MEIDVEKKEVNEHLIREFETERHFDFKSYSQKIVESFSLNEN